ncbi:hypothetical protein b3_0034 [Synechococcus phage B3]|nr:hypothetical protein b3_0034 [Synechococcus phage B3]
MIDTLSFNYGNLTTIIGFVGIVSSFVIIATAFTKHYNSPVNK